MGRGWTDEQLAGAVASSSTVAQALRKIGLVPRGGNYKNIRGHINRLGLSTEHFLGKSWARGTRSKYVRRIPLEEVLVDGSTYGTSQLRKRLIATGILPDECSVCGIREWLGKVLVLHLDHINGRNNDNRLCNLRLLCPNCHSQTDTYCGKNTRGHSRRRSVEYHCACGARVSRWNGRCRSCAAKAKDNYKIDWPPREVVIELLGGNSYASVGRQLGVSDNAVRKFLARTEH